MEGLPSGDIQAKYQKLAAEYSKLRVHVKVLKKGVLDEQAKSNELRDTLKEKEKCLRKGELEIDSLTFRNQQLTRRVSVLQDELDALQLKLTKKSKSKGDDKQPAASSAGALDSGLLQEELQKKIIENAQFASQLSDKIFEISQLRASLDDYQRHISESDSKYKCEIAKLKNKNQELQYSLEEAQRERIGGTPSKIHLATSSQAASCNGDFLSEGGSLVGSEDALSSVDDLNVTEQISMKAHSLDQLKLTKKSKSKGDDKQPAASSAGALDSGLLQEELQKKIIENAQFASQLSDKIFEISQLRASLDDYQRHISESDSKYKCEIAKLKNKNQELQYSLEEAQRERIGGTPSKIHLATSSQAASCNGDFLSEGGSLVGSEDALSSVDDLNVTEQISMKAHSLDQENQKLKMEFEMLRMENESLKLEVAKYVSASQKRRGDGHDSGDFNTFGETSVDAEGRVTGLLGSLQVPFILDHEIEMREERMKTYFRNKISELKTEREELKSKTEHYVKECEMLRLRFEEMERDKQIDEYTLSEKHNTISRLEEELHSTSHNYEEQMSVLTEHVAGLNEQLTRQHDEIQQLKHTLHNRRK
uniref:Protein phosphatase 1 regulatory subunit 21 N-terminal domain-containing protein n=1 Tax=Heliothis virescens TaxID=7102 RepID=A0A2A4IU10_HELVI